MQPGLGDHGAHLAEQFKHHHLAFADHERCNDLLALKRIDEKTHRVPRHRDDKGRPKFNVNFYAMDAKGRTAGAALWSGSKYVVGDNDGVKVLESAYLYKRDK